jgi:hypothetical protein
MDSIKFVPQSQKNLEQLEEYKTKKNGNSLIYILVSLFVVYSIVIFGVYWFFVVREQNRVDKAIQDLDSVNSQYYINDDLEQGLFNIMDLIDKYYNPAIAIKEIESAYVPGAIVTSFTYSKTSKIINIAMLVPSINDVTSQIDRFNQLESVSASDYSLLSVDNEGTRFSFGVEIILK